MKYLKRYNESNSTIDSIVENCKDILLPLSDDSIYVDVLDSIHVKRSSTGGYGTGKKIVVVLGDEDITRGFPKSVNYVIDTNKYSDDLLRLIGYLKKESFKLSKFDYSVDTEGYEVQTYKDFGMGVDLDQSLIEHIDSPIYIKLYFNLYKTIL